MRPLCLIFYRPGNLTGSNISRCHGLTVRRSQVPPWTILDVVFVCCFGWQCDFTVGNVFVVFCLLILLARCLCFLLFFVGNVSVVVVVCWFCWLMFLCMICDFTNKGIQRGLRLQRGN